MHAFLMWFTAYQYKGPGYQPVKTGIAWNQPGSGFDAF